MRVGVGWGWGGGGKGEGDSSRLLFDAPLQPLHAHAGRNLAAVCREFEGGYFGDLANWQYNASFAAAAGLAAPPKQFSVVYVDGWGVHPIEEVTKTLAPLTADDVVISNVGAHAVRQLPWPEWRQYIDRLAAVLQASPAAVVWRTTMPISEHLLRKFDGSTFWPEAHFQVGSLAGGADLRSAPVKPMCCLCCAERGAPAAL